MGARDVYGVWWRHLGVVAVDIPLSDIEDLVHTSVPPGSHPHVFVVDRIDQTVLIHPFFKNSFEVGPQCCVTFFIYWFLLILFNVWKHVSSTINRWHKDNGTNLFKVITGQNNTTAYLIPQNQCRVNSTMHYITIYSIKYVYTTIKCRKTQVTSTHIEQ